MLLRESGMVTWQSLWKVDCMAHQGAFMLAVSSSSPTHRSLCEKNKPNFIQKSGFRMHITVSLTTDKN
jgi:hypothetical protein